MEAALVTGSSRGLGKAIAKQLSADHKLHILVNYVTNQEAAQETLNEIISAGGSGDILGFNVQVKSEVDEALNNWHKQNQDKQVSVLVNNAGIAKDNLFMWMPESDWDEVLNISAKGMFNVTQNILQPMLRKRSGRIINIVSLSGLKGVPGQTNYSAAKGAVIAATRSLAQEVAKRNITVNAVAPGFIQTDMTASLDEKELSKLIPMQRFGTPEDVAHLVSFLASEKASYITGEIVNINGGIHS